ncbi:MAG: cache domain-containing protein [Bacteroidota bacterium]
MKLQMKLKHKVQILLIFISAVIYLLAIGYISLNARQDSYRNAKNLIDSKVNTYARQIESKMNSNMTVTRTMALSFSNYDFMPEEEWFNLINNMYEDVFPKYTDIYNLWDSWELSVIDSSWEKSHGRIVNEHFRDEGVIEDNQSKRSLEGDNELYKEIKKQNQEMIIPLYFDRFAEGKSERKLMTSLIVPIKNESGKFAGVVGVDITMDQFQKMLQNISVENQKGSHAFLLSHKGKYAAHPDTSLLNEKIQKNPTGRKDFDVFKKLDQGESFSLIHRNELNEKHYVSYAPVNIGNTDTPWHLGISVPVASIMEEANRDFIISLIVGIIGLFILSLVIYYVTRSITRPIEQITEVLKQMARGRIDNRMKLSIDTGDEIEEMGKALNTSIDGLNKKNEFAGHLSNEELDYEYTLLSNEDHLGQSLLEMRDSLKKAREEQEKQKIEEQKRQWTNEGLARFADIQRQNNDNLQKLSDELIKNLVYYLEANQGGIFLVNDEDENDKHLELISAFAYDRKKYLEKRIDFGDGLVGTCAIEKQSIYMEDIPQDYIEITSGLGDANPDSLLIVPLKLEEELHGIIEIASFNTFQRYQIDFVEKVAESIASTISSVKVNMKTQRLLEQSEQQSQELSAQEEEMRQNMEELKATQEENARQKTEMEHLINAFHKANYVVEYDPNEKIIDINEKYLNLVGLKREEVIGTHHSYKLQLTKEQEESYNQFWEDLRAGKVKKDINRVEVNGNTHVLAETYTPIMDDEGNVKKILKIAFDTSEFNL